MYTSEEQIYDAIVKEIEILGEPADKLIRFSGRAGDNKLVHLIGDAFPSRRPIDFLHATLSHEMRNNPSDWVVMYDGAEIVINKVLGMTNFYLQELTALLSIPTEPTIYRDPFCKDIVEYVEEKTGINERELQKLAILNFDSGHLDRGLESNPKIIDRLSSHFKETPEYVLELIDEMKRDERVGRKSNSNLRDLKVLNGALQGYDSEGFLRFLGRYPDRNSFLVSTKPEYLQRFLGFFQVQQDLEGVSNN